MLSEKRNMRKYESLISVLMTVFNGERFIAEALHSIIQQPYAPIEIIVIDDGSTDRTAEIVRSIAAQANKSIHYVYQPNRGQTVAQNHALRLAQGEIIGFLDADDLWVPNRLESQLALLTDHCSTDADGAWIVLGRIECFVDGAQVDPTELEKFNQRPFHYSLGSSLIDRRAFENVGGFNESLRMAQDWDWFMRAKDAGIESVVSSAVTLLQRLHPQNVTRQREAGAHYTAQFLLSALKRRRAREQGKQD